MDENQTPSEFKQEDMDAAVQIWNRSVVSVLDVRHSLLSPNDVRRSYRLPSSAFLYTSGGKAEVLMDDATYNVERFGLFHAGKGTELTILARCDWLEYYMVLYRAAEPPFHRGEYYRLMEQINPFRQQYGFAPSNPVLFSEELRKLYERWKEATSLSLFYGKATFYRFVYALYEELEQGHIHVFEPDVIAMAKRYFNEHYSEFISIQDMCRAMGVSYSHFHRSFKQQTGKGPQAYLIKARLAAAQKLLQNEGYTIREVASYCGFQDERNFQRLFSKHTGVSPNAYRENAPLRMRADTLGKVLPFSYNEERQVSVDELREKGASFMFKQMRGKAVVAAALSLMLLMSACSAVPASSSGPDAMPTATIVNQATQPPQTEPEQAETRIVNTVMGDVEVSMNPQRVVSQGYWVGDLLALGIMPVGIEDFYTTSSPWAEQAKDVDVLERWEPEHIMALEPDLIITGYQDDYDKLKAIAPTVVIPWGTKADERLELIAAALGKERTDGAALVEKYREKAADYLDSLSRAGILEKTITVFRNDGVVEGGLELGSAMGWGGDIVYGLFGMNMPESAVKHKESNSANVSFEVVPQLCGDIILVNQQQEALIKSLEDNPIWQSIPAVQEGHVISIAPGKIFFQDIITETYKLEAIAEALLELDIEQ